MTTRTADMIAAGSTPSWQRWLRRHGWTVGVWLLLVVLVSWYSTLIPSFGSFQFATIITNGTPWVFLAAAQAVVVIAGGLDLGVGGMLVLTKARRAETTIDTESDDPETTRLGPRGDLRGHRSGRGEAGRGPARPVGWWPP